MDEETNYYETIKRMITKNSEYLSDLMNIHKAEVASVDIEKYKEVFNTITRHYIRRLNTLLNNMSLLEIKNSVPTENQKAWEYLKVNILNQISTVSQCPLFQNEYFDNFIKDEINFTRKEKEILSLIYYCKLNYSACKAFLCIEPRTFKNHLERIVKKIYVYIQNKKMENPNLEHTFPNFKEKEDNSSRNKNDINLKTYANPWDTIIKFINIYF